jgi:hypothetical protein
MWPRRRSSGPSRLRTSRATLRRAADVRAQSRPVASAWPRAGEPPPPPDRSPRTASSVIVASLSATRSASPPDPRPFGILSRGTFTPDRWLASRPGVPLYSGLRLLGWRGGTQRAGRRGVDAFVPVVPADAITGRGRPTHNLFDDPVRGGRSVDSDSTITRAPTFTPSLQLLTRLKERDRKAGPERASRLPLATIGARHEIAGHRNDEIR